MKTSDTLTKFAPAFVKAQGNVKRAIKDSNNPAFKAGGKVSTYADLTSVWDACADALKGAELGVIQLPGLVEDDKMHMETMLLHSSGEYIADTLSIPLGKIDAQGYGSAVTYARRYALGAMMGICPEDDDGNAASAAAPQRREPTHATGASAKTDTVTEPPEGWGDFTRAKIVEIARTKDTDALDVLLDSVRGIVGPLKAHDAEMFKSLDKAFRDRRAIFAGDLPA